MKAGGALSLSQLLASLDGLDDAELHAVVARAQSLLLDRPIFPDATPALAVEVVEREEGRLLAAYRALAPLDRRRLLGYVMHLVGAPHRLVRRRKPAVLHPGVVAAATLPAPLLTGRERSAAV